MIDVLQQMLEILIITALEFYLDDVSVIFVLDDKVEGRDDLEYAAESDFLHAIII